MIPGSCAGSAPMPLLIGAYSVGTGAFG
eukprot:COSAG01_NODE_31611_length_594_cov_2.335354_1_plen_27_part_10